MRSALVVAATIAAAACGRLRFEPQHDGSDGSVNADATDATDAIDAAPDPLGCADGTREAFADLAQFPTIAGCAASWTGGHDLRAAGTGSACGDTLGPCDQPADACAAGWHVCGLTGDPTEVSLRITAGDCAGATGGFVAAFGHCAAFTPPSTCTYAASYPCMAAQYCAEPVCCGTSCGTGNACTDALFPGTTAIVGGAGYCDAVSATSGLTGVMCCR